MVFWLQLLLKEKLEKFERKSDVSSLAATTALSTKIGEVKNEIRVASDAKIEN